MKTLKFILIISALLVTLFCNNSFAEEKLKLKLTRPPLNELRANNMWDFSIKNLTQGDLEFTLNGTLKESKAGLIAKGQTVPIKIKKGETIQFKISDLQKTPDIEYVHPDQRYKDALIRAGNLPEGNYEICIYAKQTGTGEEIGSDCIEQEISKILEGDLTLLTPENGAKLEEKETPIFSWMANGMDKDASFTLEIYEMSSGEKGEDAVKSGKSFYKTETKQTKVTYNGPKFTNGKQYAWVVRSGSNRSNVSTFITSSAIQVRCGIDSVTCTGKAGEYRIVFKVCIDYDNSAFATANLQNILFSSNCIPATSAVTYSISNYKDGSTSVTLPQTIIRPSTGSNCLNLSAIVNTSPASTISALEIKAMLTYNNYPTDPSAVVYPPSGVFSGIIACPCCQNFKATINNPVVHGSGNNFIFESNISSTGGPYTKVTSELVYFALNPTSNGTYNDTCLNCTRDSKLMGNFTGGTLAGFNLGGLVGSSAGGFSRGIEFVSATSAGVDLTSGKDIKINFLGPNIKSLSCCSFKLYYCIRLSFTNTNCQTCDTLICGSYDVKPRGQIENLENGPKGQGERSEAESNTHTINRSGILESSKINDDDKCSKEECKATSVNISTGFNHNSGTIYNNTVTPAVDQDPFWILTGAPSDPNFPVNLNTPAWVIKKDGAWTNMPNSAYLSPFKNCSTNLDNRNATSTPYTFERCFCVCTNDSIHLKFDLRADNWARVLLDGNELASFGTPPSSNMTTSNFQGSPITVDTTIFLMNGKHCLSVELRNDGTVSMGFCLLGSITANSNLFLKTSCCDPSSFIIGTKYWDKNCNGILDEGDVKIPGVTINLLDASGSIIRTSVTDAEGQYVFNNLNAGTYSVTEQQLENCQYSQPSNGRYDNIVLLSNEVKNLDFLNCCDGDPKIPVSIDCCKDFKTKIEIENFSAGLPSAEATVYSFTPKFTVGPNPIRKVSMVMEYMNVSYEDRDCYVCAQNPISYGNFFCRTESATLGNIKPSCPVNIWGLGIGREIVWGNNSSSINLNSGVILGDVIYLLFPPSSTLKCCKPKFEFCIRYKFTDINCRTCETLVCYTIENGKLNPPSLRTEQKGNLKMEEIIKVQKELNQNNLSK